MRARATAGTPVSTSAGFEPIETVQPGDRVRSLDEPLCTEPVDADTCRTVEITMDDPYGYPDTLRARFLRSAEWVGAHAVEPGAEIALDLEELAVRGRGRVVSVGPCALERGPGCLVTGTVTHLNRSVLRLRFADSDVTLEPTALHRLWSVDRAAWVPAGELEVGERLRTEDGEVTIAAIERLDGAHPVFNMEVAGAHTYLASALRIQSHNTGCGVVRGPYLDEIERHWHPDLFGRFVGQPLVEIVRVLHPQGRAAMFLEGRFKPKGWSDQLGRVVAVGEEWRPVDEAFHYVLYEARKLMRDPRLPAEARKNIRELYNVFRRW